jgi:hypothetical protein
LVIMRNLTLAVATLASAFALLHCAGGSSGSPTSDAPPATTTSDAGTVAPPKPKSTTPSSDAGPTKSVADAGVDAAPPVKGAKDAGTNPAATGPGPSCTALSACCGKLSNSLEQVGCLIASGKKNELVCDGALVTFNCAAANNPGHGPSCLGLIPFIKYCGNDGPKGDANTLYECNTSGNISIVRQCANGCQTNFGVDDSCVADTGGGGGTTGGGGDAASCKGYSGMFCGSDGVGGNPNTLYDCESDAIASKQVCANGCVTNPDATLNDYCADAPPAGGGGGGSSGPSCTGLPDFKYCGSDGVNGDANTLYTCAGGKLTDSQPCANGCTIGSSNTDDYCAFSPGGGGGNTANCTGLTDGTYCGSNGPTGDPDTLYTCAGGSVSGSQVCSAGCYAGDFGGSDSCN